MNISRYVLTDKKVELYVKKKGEEILALKINGNTMGATKRIYLEPVIKKYKDIRRVCDKMDELSINFEVLDDWVESYLYDWL